MQMLSESTARRTVRALELDNLPVVGFKSMHLHHNTQASLCPQCKCVFLLSTEMGSVFRTRWLCRYCFQLQMEHRFNLTEGVIISQTLELTVVFGHFM